MKRIYLLGAIAVLLILTANIRKVEDIAYIHNTKDITDDAVQDTSNSSSVNLLYWEIIPG